MVSRSRAHSAMSASRCDCSAASKVADSACGRAIRQKSSSALPVLVTVGCASRSGSGSGRGSSLTAVRSCPTVATSARLSLDQVGVIAQRAAEGSDEHYAQLGPPGRSAMCGLPNCALPGQAASFGMAESAGRLEDNAAHHFDRVVPVVSVQPAQ